MKNRMLVPFFLMAFILICVSLKAQIPLDYYTSLNGKSGSELKTAVYNLIKNAQVLSYGSGSGHTWQGFYSTDRAADNSVIDRYSNDIRYFGNEGSVVSGAGVVTAGGVVTGVSPDSPEDSLRSVALLSVTLL